MTDRSIYRRTIEALKEAGYVVTRHRKHEYWRAPGKQPVSISKGMQDKQLARSILRSVGLEFK